MKRLFSIPLLNIFLGTVIIYIITQSKFLTTVFNKLSYLILIFLYATLFVLVFNRPYNKLVKLLSRKSTRAIRFKRTLSLFIIYVVFFIVIILSFIIIVPKLSESISLLYSNIDTYARNISKGIKSSISSSELFSYISKNISLDTLLSQSTSITDFFKSTSSMIRQISALFIGTVLSIYVLIDKGAIKEVALKFIEKIFPSKVGFTKDLLSISQRTFSSYFVGQGIDSLLLGGLCFVSLFVLKFEYPLIISFIVAISSMVPIVGTILGSIPCVLLLMSIDFSHGLWFILIIIILQQIEGNLIYPKVVGAYVKLSGFFTLTGVIVGGTLFGVLGIFISIPIISIFVNIMRDKE